MEVAMSTTFDHTSPSFGAGAYSSVTAHMAVLRRELLRRAAAEYWRRYMLSVLDAAIEQCERRNLAAPDGVSAVPPPKRVVDLIEQLQGERDLEIRPPCSNQEALDVLFELEQAYMPFAADAGDEDGPWAA